MLELTHNNCIKFGYDDRPFGLRTKLYDRFWVSQDRCTQAPGTLRDECIRAAKLIGQKYQDQTIWICFSGGTDSEVLLQSFMFAGVPFKIAIMEFTGGYNKHDIVYATEFCDRHSLPYTIFPVDLDLFISSGQYLEYGIKYQCKEIAIIMMMKLFDLLDGVPILGGESLVHKRYNHEKMLTDDPTHTEYCWYHKFRENNDSATMKYAVANNKTIISEFFSYTPELLLSFLQDPIVSDICNNRVFGKVSLLSSKFKIYGQHFLLQARPKYHGYETIRLINYKTAAALESVVMPVDSIAETEYNQMIQQLLPIPQ